MWHPYHNIGGKTVKNVQIDSQTKIDMAETAKRYIVCEGGGDTLVREKLNF